MKSRPLNNRSGRDRPLGIYVLVFAAICLAAWNILRLSQGIFFWKTLQVYGAYPLYIAMTAIVWMIIGLTIAWGVWQGKPWGWMAAVGGSAAYTIWYWFDRLVLQKPHANWPFSLVANLILLLLVLTILFSRKARLFFHRVAYD